MDRANVREDNGRRLAKIERNKMKSSLKLVVVSSANAPADDPRDWWRTRFIQLEYITSFSSG